MNVVGNAVSELGVVEDNNVTRNAEDNQAQYYINHYIESQ